MFDYSTTEVVYKESMLLNDHATDVFRRHIGIEAYNNKGRYGGIHKAVDIFHTNFDAILSELPYLSIEFTAKIPEKFFRESGVYDYPDLFEDCVAEIGRIVPAGYKLLTVKGTNAESMRRLIVAIRKGAIRPSENWEKHQLTISPQDLVSRMDDLEERLTKLE